MTSTIGGASSGIRVFTNNDIGVSEIRDRIETVDWTGSNAGKTCSDCFTQLEQSSQKLHGSLVAHFHEKAKSLPLNQVTSISTLTAILADPARELAMDKSFQLDSAAYIETKRLAARAKKADLFTPSYSANRSLRLYTDNNKNAKLENTIRRRIGKLPDSISRIKKHFLDNFYPVASTYLVVERDLPSTRRNETSAQFRLPSVNLDYVVSFKEKKISLQGGDGILSMSEPLYAELTDIAKTVSQSGSISSDVKTLLERFVIDCRPTRIRHHQGLKDGSIQPSLPSRQTCPVHGFEYPSYARTEITSLTLDQNETTAIIAHDDDDKLSEAEARSKPEGKKLQEDREEESGGGSRSSNVGQSEKVTSMGASDM